MSVTDNKPVKYKNIPACNLRVGMFLYEGGAQLEVLRIVAYTQDGTTYRRVYVPALITGAEQVWATYENYEDINVVATADDF